MDIDIDFVKMTALEFLISMRPALPMSVENPCKQASNSEIRRWLDQSSVIINGVKPKSKDVVNFPVTSLVFFPKSKATFNDEGKMITTSRKTTLI